MRPATNKWLTLSALALLSLGVSAASMAADPGRDVARGGSRGGAPAARQQRAPGASVYRGGRGEFLDNRYNHGHYYPRSGVVVRSLPGGYRPYYYHGSHYYFSGGIWYAPGPAGFIVTRPPSGLFVSVLPPFYSTVWLGGVPYYYADDVYYRWQPGANGYAVVDPPAGADEPGTPPAGAPADDFFIYPKNGQTQEQQAADQYECHDWSKNQTGFDPTQQGGGVAPNETGSRREQYQRAMTACLEARGYSVK